MERMEVCELTCMVMVEDGDRVLVQDRKKKDWPGINFPGGHVEERESFVRAAQREVKEETGLDVWNLRLCGMKQFTLKDGDFRYIVLFFKTNCFTGDLRPSGEGEVFWVRKDELQHYTLAPGFDTMYEVFSRDDLTENYHWVDDNSVWRSENL